MCNALKPFSVGMTKTRVFWKNKIKIHFMYKITFYKFNTICVIAVATLVSKYLKMKFNW